MNIIKALMHDWKLFFNRPSQKKIIENLVEDMNELNTKMIFIQENQIELGVKLDELIREVKK